MAGRPPPAAARLFLQPGTVNPKDSSLCGPSPISTTGAPARRSGSERGRTAPNRPPKRDAMVGFIAIGVAVGAVARLIFAGPRHLRTLTALFIGTLGGMVGGVAANALTFRLIFELNVVSGAGAAFAAAVCWCWLSGQATVEVDRPRRGSRPVEGLLRRRLPVGLPLGDPCACRCARSGGLQAWCS